MDPRERADAALARARARGAFVVTPEDAISPMDAANTLQIPRVVVASLDENHQDSEATMVVGHPLTEPQPTQRQPSPRRPQPFPASQGQIETPPHGLPRQTPAPEPQQPEPQPEGMVPTVKKPSPRPSLSQRLDGKF